VPRLALGLEQLVKDIAGQRWEEGKHRELEGIWFVAGQGVYG